MSEWINGDNRQQLDSFRVRLVSALRSLTDVVEIQMTAARLLGEHLSASRVLFFETENGHDSDYLNIQYEYFAPGISSMVGQHRANDFAPFLAAMFQSWKPVIVDDLDTDPRISASERFTYQTLLDVRAYIAVPFIKNEQTVAVLIAHQAIARTWTATEVELVQETAERAWTAIQHAQTEAALAADLRATRLLHDLAMQVVTDGQEQELYERILDAAIALMHADMGGLQILDSERNQLQLQAQRGLHPRAIAFWQTVDLDSGGSCSVALQQGERLIVPDIDAWDLLTGTADAEFYHLCGIKAEQSTPLLSRSGQLIGMFSTQWHTRHYPCERDLQFLELLARQAADLIEQQRAKVIYAANLRDTQRLSDLGARLVAEDNVQTVYEEIVETAVTLMHADAGTLQMLEPATQDLLLLAAQGLERSMQDHFYRVNASSQTSCGNSLVSGIRAFIDFDVPASEDPDGSCRLHVEAGYRSAQSTPLKTRDGQPIGMLSTHWHENHRPSDRELQFLDLLARQAADLITQWQDRNALQRYNEELETKVAERTAELSQSLAELEKSREQLHHQAHHDSLTDLPNRLSLNLRLKLSLQQVSRLQTQLAVVFIDLDRFKQINDSLGHCLGDELLQQVARRLQQAIQSNDTIARLSGDEFVVLFTDIQEQQQVVDAANRLIACFESPFDLSGQRVHTTASLGVCLVPDDGTDVNVLLRNADTAMYSAKEAGRNTYCFYDEAMTVAAIQQGSLENALRMALNRKEFTLVYQPQIDLQSQTWIGLEAFLRWQHPELGTISPVQFIPIAEQSGLIRDVCAWVLRTACLQGRTWLDQGLNFGRIAVNIDASQFKDKNFIYMIQSALESSGLSPSCLELEVTESLLMDHTEEKIQLLNQLRQLGIQLSIDDFGTGYSSLSYLKRLPIDKLKIDQSFVQDIPNAPNDMAIAEAIIALGQALDIKIIAEGVETEKQAEFLKMKGCHEAQGYLYSHPLSAAEIEQKL
ncbi:MAG: EAL domain-containing protein [Cyanobacteria bacterium P01_F01_bin.13]